MFVNGRDCKKSRATQYPSYTSDSKPLVCGNAFATSVDSYCCAVISEVAVIPSPLPTALSDSIVEASFVIWWFPVLSARIDAGNFRLLAILIYSWLRITYKSLSF